MEKPNFFLESAFKCFHAVIDGNTQISQFLQINFFQGDLFLMALSIQRILKDHEM